MQVRDWITKIQEISGSKSDVLTYLQEFRSLPKSSFALVYCESSVFAESLEPLVYATKFLYELSLYPVLLIDHTSLSYLHSFFHKDSFFSHKIFRAKTVTVSQIQECIQEEKIPLLVREETKEELTSTVQRFLKALSSRKFLYVLEEGGIQEGEQLISVLNLTKDKESKLKSSHVLDKGKELIRFSEAVLDHYSPPRFTISYVAAYQVLKELFTIKGSGTLVKKGSGIQSYSEIPKPHQKRIQSLIEESFQKKLKPDFLNSPIRTLYLESQFRACSILKDTPVGVFLSKFAVGEIARGEGIGREIWDKMTSENPKFFWRAKRSNSINKWYAKEATGLHKHGDWIYYWIGFLPEEIPRLVEYLQNLEEDFLFPSRS